MHVVWFGGGFEQIAMSTQKAVLRGLDEGSYLKPSSEPSSILRSGHGCLTFRL
jgi:hypothetical protein